MTRKNGLGIYRRVECDVKSLNAAFDVLEVERSKTVVRTHERLVECEFMQISWLIDRLGRMRISKSCIRHLNSHSTFQKSHSKTKKSNATFINSNATCRLLSHSTF